MSLSYALGYTRQLRPESGGGGGGGGGSNIAPVIDLNGAGSGINNTGTFTEGDSYTSYLSAATLTDPDGDPIGSLTMTCGGSWGDDGPDELIKFDTWTTDSDTDKTENLVVGSTTFRLAFVAATGVLTITNSADESFPAADGQSLIRLFQYANSAEPPTEGDRTFTWVASDTPVPVLESDIFRVRRSSDSAEEDYTLTEVDDGTLDTFVGAGDGCVATWYDDSGNDNDVVQSTTTLQPKVAVAGVVQEGVVFDGTDDYFPLTVADLTVAGQTSVSWCGWVRFSSYAAISIVYMEATSSAGYSRLQLRSDTATGKFAFGTRDAAADPTGTSNVLLSTTVLSLDTWYHVVCVYAANSKKIYINGVLDASSTPTTGVFGSSTSNGIRIGSSDVGAFPLAGRLSDLRLYRGDALDDTEVASVAAGGEVGSPLLWLKGNYSP